MSGIPQSDIDAEEFLQRIELIADHIDKFRRFTQQAQDKVDTSFARFNIGELISESGGDITWLRHDGQRLVRQLDQYDELARTSALITSTLDLDKVLEDVMDTVIELTGAQRGYLMLRTPDSEEFSIRAARNWDGESLHQDEITFSRGIVDKAMESGQPILTTNAQTDERFQGMKSVAAHALRAIIVIPLVLQGKALGVLYVDNRLSSALTGGLSVSLLAAFASQATIAIENARVFGKIKSDLKEAQREVQRLRIQIDDGDVGDQVGEITESEYFQRVAKIAEEMRKRRKSKKS